MNELPTRYKKQIRKFLPIETEGITLYPVTVEYWEEFRACVPALEFMRKSLPVVLMQMPLLNALAQIELVNNYNLSEGKETGVRFTFFSDTLYALCLALRLGLGMERDKVLAERVSVISDRLHPENIERIFFTTDDKDFISITPRQYERLRPILAAQNGVTIPSDDENPELVYADRVLRAQKTPKLEEDFAKMVSWCAVFSHAEEEEIYNWPILKFLNRCEVSQRSLDYVIFGVGAASGFAKYEGGPPVPSPFYAKKESAADRLLTGGSAAADEAVRSGLDKAQNGPTNPTRKD